VTEQASLSERQLCPIRRHRERTGDEPLAFYRAPNAIRTQQSGPVVLPLISSLGRTARRRLF